MGLHDGHRQRKRQQFLEHGPQSMADHELLELALYYAIPRRDTNETAHRLLEHFGSLDRVLCAPVMELKQVSGMGENAALLLRLIPAVVNRARQRELAEERIITSVEQAGNYFLRLLESERVEVLYQLCVDNKGKVLACRCLSRGQVDSAVLNVRQVAENALAAGATGVFLGHNHPSGVALPSAEDIHSTLLVQKALEPLEIRLLDHIVVADGDYVSLNASGALYGRHR